MHFFLNPSRRGFLKTVAAAIASLIRRKSLTAEKPDKKFWFVHSVTGSSWSVADPVQWSLEHAHEPVLERARDGLLNLTPGDGDRVIRLVTRRCRLNLLELHSDQVVVHHWGQQRRDDLRPFFKSLGLARNDVQVVIRDRKKETVTTESGDDFLFGDQLAADWPLELYQSKWVSRFVQEDDDRTAAPGTWSGFGWEGVEDNRIPWTALKSAWRRSVGWHCLNCDQPTLLANFGLRQVGMFNRSPRFLHVCGACRRSFRDESVRDVAGWMALNLDAEILPGFEMVWNRRVKWEGKS